ncbi:MAG: hypothetical protein LBF67_05700 [Prevotellaceae bacterium]|jgi:hypothetical protein|nr:hypothetical protein [Prevotellaceae bacterium]
MRINRRILAPAALLLTTNLYAVQEVKPEWNVAFFSFADNREYEPAQHQLPQSILGSWLIPEVGLRFDSVHRLHAGVGLQHYFGSADKALQQVEYVAYYRYNSKPFELYVGSFPARRLLADYPNALFYDSIVNLRLNSANIFWKIFGEQWHADIWLDWSGRQTETQRETFLVGIAGKYRLKKAYVALQSYMHHFAHAAGNIDQHIVDNGMARLCVGVSMPVGFLLDSLNVNAGMLGAYSRERGVDPRYQFSGGFFSEVTLEKFGIGVKNTLYAGENLMPLHNKYNAEHLYWGDPFYQNTFYNRSDFYVYIFDTNKIQARFTWSMHAAAGLISNQQMFTLTVNLGSQTKAGAKRNNRRTLAAELGKLGKANVITN